MSSYAFLDMRFRMTPAERRGYVDDFQQRGLMFSTPEEGLEHCRSLHSDESLINCHFMVCTHLRYVQYRCVVTYNRRENTTEYSVAQVLTFMIYDLAG